MQDFKVRDVHLDACGERHIRRDRVEAYMRHLGVNLVWVKRDETIKADGSKQCTICLETRTASEFKTIGKAAKEKTTSTCWTCRKLYGYGASGSRGSSQYMIGSSKHVKSSRRPRTR